MSDKTYYCGHRIDPIEGVCLVCGEVESTPVWRKVRMTETLFLELGASRVDWGEPDAEGFYTPTLRLETP